MDSHLVGKGQNSGGDSPVSTSGGTSLVVRLFMDVVYGRTAVHVPQNEFVTVAVEVEVRYCLKCFGVRTFDVIIGQRTVGGGRRQAAYCRCCGAEVLG